jgi:purine-cytosine permease-like protein
VAYETFLLLIGSVFVPLFAVAITDFFLGSGAAWDLSHSAPARWWLALPWALGFLAYQLVNPGSVARWADIWTALRDAIGFTAPTWMSASILSFIVAAVGTLLLTPLTHARGRPPSGG